MLLAIPFEQFGDEPLALAEVELPDGEWLPVRAFQQRRAFDTGVPPVDSREVTDDAPDALR